MLDESAVAGLSIFFVERTTWKLSVSNEPIQRNIAELVVRPSIAMLRGYKPIKKVYYNNGKKKVVAISPVKQLLNDN